LEVPDGDGAVYEPAACDDRSTASGYYRAAVFDGWVARELVGGSFMRGRITATVIGAAILIGGYAAVQGGGEELEANAWAAASGGNENCVRSSTLLTYSEAQAANAVCNSMHSACRAAAGGDLVLFKAGNYSMTYTQFDLPTDHDDGLGHDCSDGAGGAYNPNWQEQGLSQPTYPPPNWVRFECGDGEDADVNFAPPGSDDMTHYFVSNAHVHFYGGCFRFGDLRFDYSGGTGLNAQNIIVEGGTRRWSVYAMEQRGAKNILTKKWEANPLVLCAATTTGYASKYKCVPSTTSTGEDWGETMNVGPASLHGVQIPWTGRNSSGATINYRSEDGLVHDLQTKNANEIEGDEWHSGCGYTYDNDGVGANGTDNADASHNIVIDELHCYRVNVFGYQVQNANGVTIQNSSFGAPNIPMDSQTPDNTYWYQPLATQPGITVVCNGGETSQSNVLVRYNSSVGPIHMTSCLTGSNMEVIGNVALNGYSCDAYATWDYNVSGTSACGTNSTGGAASPFTTDVRSTIAYPPSAGETSASNVGFDATLTGTNAWENAITPTSLDYALPLDKDGDTRTAPRTAGADER
jgi:hypothetical protein